MYSKELEELIENVLEDGVITEQERAVLRKRAQACGEDPDEVLVVVEGRLAKAKKAAKPSNEKRGNVVHCPACGAIVEAGSPKCKECGYVFTNVKAINSAERFAKELAMLIDKYKDGDDKEEQRDMEINEFIKNFPIPTGKEDMLEFIASMDARRRSDSDYRESYRSKYKECVTKAKVQFAGDTQISELLSQTEKFSFSTIPSGLKTAIGFGIFFLICGLILGSFYYSDYQDRKVAPEKAELIDKQYDDICEKVNALPAPTKSNYDDCAMAIKRISWKKISDGNRDSRGTESYEDDVKKKAIDKINGYIDMLHTIHSMFIDPKGNPTDQNYSHDSEGNIIDHTEDSKYVEKIYFEF